MNAGFGISFSGSIENLKKISGALKQSRFGALELGGDCLGPGVWKNPPPLRIESIDDLISPMDARALMNQKESLRRQFLLELAKKIEIIPDGVAKFASIDFSVEDCIGDMFYYDDLVGLMKKIAAMLLKRKLSLCLPVRAPLAVKEADAEFYRTILTDIMLPNCLLALEIFPHEFRKKEELKVAFRAYRFDLGIVRIKYEFGSGNIISEKLFGEIFSALDALPSRALCFFDPMTYEFAPMRAEIMRISEFIK